MHCEIVHNDLMHRILGRVSVPSWFGDVIVVKSKESDLQPVDVKYNDLKVIVDLLNR